MNFSRLSRTEIVATIGGALLAIGLFLKWYEGKGKLAVIADHKGVGSYSGWQVHDLQRYLLLAAAVAPFILAYIIVRGHKLSWARGEMTAVSAIAAFGLVAYDGIIQRPGEPRALIGLKFGWVVALVGTILMTAGAALRASESERPRKPPGVL